MKRLPDVTQDEAKHIADTVKEIVDPVYIQLVQVSDALARLGIGAIDITTPTGRFRWQPDAYAREKN